MVSEKDGKLKDRERQRLSDRKRNRDSGEEHKGQKQSLRERDIEKITKERWKV